MLSDRRAQAILPTSDIDTMRSFYEEVLGFTPAAVRPAAVFYRSGDGWFASSRSGGKPDGNAAWFKDPGGNLLGLFELDEPF